MKRLLALLAVGSALGALMLALGASVAAAESGITTTQYTAGPYPMGENSSGFTDWWTCSGVRLTVGTTAQDRFTCSITDQTFSGVFTTGLPWPCGCSGWLSDYDGLQAKSYDIRVSSDGTVVGKATY